MKILVVHNRYQHRGGEDAVVEAEIALLHQYGHEVQTYYRDNDEIPALSASEVAASVLWSARTHREVGLLCAEFRPAVIHAHNTFPLISPSLYWTAHQHRIPLVQTLHNFRLLCAEANFLRDGVVCEACLGHLPWRAGLHRCYRDHRLQSTAVAGMLTLHRAAGSYRARVTRYITHNAFCRDKFIAGGLPAAKLCIKPNFIDVPVRSSAVPSAPTPQGQAGGICVSRLSREKGIAVLIAAYGFGGLAPISVIGDGPLAADVQAQFGTAALGARPPAEVMQRMRAARYAIVPSICFETGSRVVIEAFACSRPVIASRIGSLGAMVADGVTGLLFRPGDARDLHAKVQWADRHPQAMEAMGRAGWEEYARRYTAARNYTSLMAIYRAAIDAPEPGPDALIEPAGEAVSRMAADTRKPIVDTGASVRS